MSPRGLSANLLRQLVVVEGIVTKCSVVRPKLYRSVHYAPSSNSVMSRVFRDATSSFGDVTLSALPSRDPATQELTSVEWGLCEFRDHQSVVLQEMPERAPAGQLPRSVEVLMDGDLSDACKPGDRVQVTGVYRALPSAFQGRSKGTFRSVLVGNRVEQLGRERQGGELTPQDVANIARVGAMPDVFEKMAASLAPSIYGHDQVKKALLLQLMGGVEKNLVNGTHIRGDINVMLIGDPSTAKSQLLRFVLNIAPLSVSTSGRGSSGVGLTAAVTQDPDTHERRLEAGAMVLADRGIVCIDEFDKMSEDDRVAIHEVMEQGSCTINKAGIHTTLNARCSVLAAANPVYGQYNRQKKPSENIALPDSLLSRFDLVFIVLDNLDAGHDRSISSHVLKMHRYRAVAGENLGDEIEQGGVEHDVVASSLVAGEGLDAAGVARETPVTTRFGHGARDGEEVFTVEFIKKYLMYCKARIHPVLSEEAASYIAVQYAHLRSKEDTKTLPVTPRTLETMIRLAVAHAKCRLSRVAELRDAMAASNLMNFALYNEVRPEEIIQQQPNDDGVALGDKRRAEHRDDEEEIGDKRPREQELPPPSYVAEGADERKRRFRKLFKESMQENRAETCVMNTLLPWLNLEQTRHGVNYAPWTEDEVWPLLREWADEDLPTGVMLAEAGGEIEIFSL